MTKLTSLLFLALLTTGVLAQPASARRIAQLETEVQAAEAAQTTALSELRAAYRKIEERLTQLIGDDERDKLLADMVRVLEDPFTEARAEEGKRASRQRKAHQDLIEAIPAALKRVEIAPLPLLADTLAARAAAIAGESQELGDLLALGERQLAQRTLLPLLDVGRSFHVRWNEMLADSHPAALAYASASSTLTTAKDALAIAKDPTLEFIIGSPDGFARVPAGEYFILADAGFAASSGRKSPVKVRIDRDVYLALTEVTVRDYLSWLKDLSQDDRAKHRPKGKRGVELWAVNDDVGEPWPTDEELDQPVRGIKLPSAILYARSVGARLPTEAEWAAMASGAAKKKDLKRYPWGKEFAPGLCSSAEDDDPAPRAVGSFPTVRGPFGHLDVVGNVAEWTMTYEKGRPIDETDIQDRAAIVRGGSFKQGADGVTTGWVWYRRAKFEADESTGFRLARDN